MKAINLLRLEWFRMLKLAIRESGSSMIEKFLVSIAIRIASLAHFARRR